MPESTSRASIIGLAILKVNWERGGRDYLDNFVPMIAECLRESVDEAVSLPNLQARLRERFGLNLPLNPLQSLLRRTADAGYLRLSDGVYRVIREKVSPAAFADVEAEVAAVYDRVVSALTAYANAQYGIKWTYEQAGDALVAFLQSEDVTLLFSAVDDSPLPPREGNLEGRYVAGAFVYDAHHSNGGLVQDLETLAKGHMLATALFLRDQGRVQQRFRNTRVFLDTSLVIYAMGYAGDDREAPRGELLELLHNAGAALRVFPETVNEVRGILDACAAIVRRGQLDRAYGPTMEYFIQQGFSSSEIDLMAARLPDKLRFMRIEIEERPDYDDRRHVIGEQGFEDRIQESIGYRNKDALRHDVDCVAAIARFRRGREVFDVEASRALFVTTNVALARETRRFFQQDATEGTVPLVLTDYALGNLLWLKNPTEAPDLPRKMMLAGAYAAMQPDDAFWVKYLTEIAQMQEKGEITADDYYILRYSTAGKRAVMDLTKGDEEAFTEGTVQEVLQVAIENVRHDLKLKLDAEEERRTSDLQTAAAREQELQLSVYRQENELEKLRDEMARREAVRHEQLTLFSRSVARWTILPLRAIGFVLLPLVVAYVFPWDLPTVRDGIVAYGLSTGILLLYVLTVVGAGWGLSLRAVLDKSEERLARSIEDRLKWLVGGPISASVSQAPSAVAASPNGMVEASSAPQETHTKVTSGAATSGPKEFA